MKKAMKERGQRTKKMMTKLTRFGPQNWRHLLATRKAPTLVHITHTYKAPLFFSWSFH